MRLIDNGPVKKPSQSTGIVKITLVCAFIGVIFVGGWFFGSRMGARSLVSESRSRDLGLLSKAELRTQISQVASEDVYQFKQNEIRLPGYAEPVILDFTFDPSLQALAEDLLSQYRPDLGVMVAMDASTGRVLAMASSNKSFEIEGNPAIGATFPSASVFKVVTAAAAIEEQKANPHTLIPYAGRDHTLFKYQVLKEKISGWRRISSLKEAFGKSINTVFGRLAVFNIGKEPLKAFSNRFGYNEQIDSEFPVELSRSANPEDSFALAEMASGYTHDNIMTPLHGAMIAGAVANDGVMMQPYFLNAAYLKSGKTIYRSEPAPQGKSVSPETAKELRTLMAETVTNGTSRKSFRGFFRGRFSQLQVGGKTGHLTDRKYKGRVDWFVGFAQAHGRKIAVSVMTMHRKYWTVKSSYLARRTFETAFSQKKVAER
jgi:peptidoglycan glycosyltransferase